MNKYLVWKSLEKVEFCFSAELVCSVFTSVICKQRDICCISFSFCCFQIAVVGNSPSEALLRSLGDVVPVIFALYSFTKQNASHLR